MEVTEEHIKRIEELLKTHQCRGRGGCCELDLQRLPKSRVMSNGEVVQCLEEDGRQCPYGLAFGRTLAFCRCPVRKYIAREFGV